MRGVPLILGHLPWSTSAGPPAAARRRSCSRVFGEMVFNRGPAGIGMIWGCAGVGLLIGGAHGLHHRAAAQLPQLQARHRCSATWCTAARICCSARCGVSRWALVFIALSRAAVGVSSVMNMSQLLRIVPDEFRGRVFATMESITWSVMMVSMTAGGHRLAIVGPAHHRRDGRSLSSTTAIFWGWAHCDRPPARTGARRRGAGGDRNPWRTDGVDSALPGHRLLTRAAPNGAHDRKGVVCGRSRAYDR